MSQYLDYQHLRGIVAIQQMYLSKRRQVARLTKRLSRIYSTLMSVMHNVAFNYQNRVIGHDEYPVCMAEISKTLSLYRECSLPVTIRSLTREVISKVYYLDFLTVELCKKYGASCCDDLLGMLVSEDWELDQVFSYQKLARFYNIAFVPISARLEPASDQLLPSAKRLIVVSNSIQLKLNGAELHFPFLTRTVVIRGYFKQDPLNLSRIGGTLQQKYEELVRQVAQLQSVSISGKQFIVQDLFKNRYLEQLSLCDFVTTEVPVLVKQLEDSFRKLEVIKHDTISQLLNEFKAMRADQQSRVLTLLLLSDQTLSQAKMIYEFLSGQTGPGGAPLTDEIYRNLHWSVQRIFRQVFSEVESSQAHLVAQEDIPYEIRIKNLRCSDVIKKKAFDKLREIMGSKDSSSDRSKATKYLEGLLSIPFGEYRVEPIIAFLSEFRQRLGQQAETFPSVAFETDTFSSMQTTLERLKELHGKGALDEAQSACIRELTASFDQYRLDRRQYMVDSRRVLDCIHGQEKAKSKILNLLGQWINGTMTGNVLGFVGSPGIGKTSLAKQGLAKCLVDAKGHSRPFVLVALGGSTDGATLEGHSYTYVGSKWGRIADILMEARCMNPIIYFDELDKVSSTAQGREIFSILTHLTDPSQNDEFEDRFFDGVKLDLSKCLIVFSYNDPEAVDPILRERIQEVHFDNLNRKEKLHIAHHYQLPVIYKNVGYNSEEIIFDDGVIEYIIDTYVYEAGVRRLKEKLFQIVQEINLQHINGQIELPVMVNRKLVDEILGNSHAIQVKVVHSHPSVGLVNGLYATKLGIGGLTPIQVSKTLSDTKLSIEMTGSQGSTMSESCKYSKTIAWNLLPRARREAIQKEWEQEGSWGLHIHAPSAAVQKDGPSAGATITTALTSVLCNIPVRHNIAMTGEIDLTGHIHRIGGLDAKVEGAVRAGVKLIIIPHSNLEDWNEIKKNFADVTDLMVVAVHHINAVLKISLLQQAELQYGPYVGADEDEYAVGQALAFLSQLRF